MSGFIDVSMLGQPDYEQMALMAKEANSYSYQPKTEEEEMEDCLSKHRLSFFADDNGMPNYRLSFFASDFPDEDEVFGHVFSTLEPGTWQEKLAIEQMTKALEEASEPMAAISQANREAVANGKLVSRSEFTTQDAYAGFLPTIR